MRGFRYDERMCFDDAPLGISRPGQKSLTPEWQIATDVSASAFSMSVCSAVLTSLLLAFKRMWVNPESNLLTIILEADGFKSGESSH